MTKNVKTALVVGSVVVGGVVAYKLYSSKSNATPATVTSIFNWKNKAATPTSAASIPSA